MQLIQQMAEYKPDLLIAGPAFESGRYGIACGAICQAAQQQLGIAAVAGMDEDNVGASLYRKNIYIINSGATIVRMVPTLQRMAALGVKLVRRETIGKPENEGYLPRGIKRNEFAAKPPASAPSTCCWPNCAAMNFIQRSPRHNLPAANRPRRCTNLKSAVIALVTDGGLVPEGNPDKIEPGRPTRFTTIPIAGVNSLDADKYDAVHSGYDTAIRQSRPEPLGAARHHARSRTRRRDRQAP